MCGCEEKAVTGDSLEAREAERYFDHSAEAWLVSKALDHLQADEGDTEGQHHYRQSIDLLGRCTPAAETVAQIFRRVPAHDVPLRWSLLYVLADVGDPKSLDLFAEVAAEPIRTIDRDPQVCESPEDGERLVRSMAVEGIARLTDRVEGAQRALESIVAVQSDPAVRCAAVQALRTVAPEAGRRIAEVLPDNHRWMAEVRQVAVHEVVAELDDSDRSDAVVAPPPLDQVVFRPQIKKES